MHWQEHLVKPVKRPGKSQREVWSGQSLNIKVIYCLRSYRVLSDMQTKLLLWNDHGKQNQQEFEIICLTVYQFLFGKNVYQLHC